MTNNTQINLPHEKKEKTVAIREALAFGWDSFLQTYHIFIPATIIVVSLEFAMAYVEKSAINEFLMIVVLILGSIAEIIIGIGFTKLSLNIVDGEIVSFDDIFSVTHLFFNFLGASLLYGLIVIGGLILFIIPGLVWLITYWFFQYALVDREKGIMDSLRSAKEASEGVRWSLAGFMIVMMVINVGGILAFGIGLFITIPVTAIASAWVYRSLTVRIKEEKQDLIEVTVPDPATASSA